jgi:hypothetical protein
MTTERPGPEQREERLAKLWRQVGKAARRGDTARYGKLKAEHDRLKSEHVRLSHEEYIAERRAQAAARRAQQPPERPGPWRLPRGFGVSPLAEARARGVGLPREEPQHPGYGLRPWRSEGPMERQIWRPGP